MDNNHIKIMVSRLTLKQHRVNKHGNIKYACTCTHTHKIVNTEVYISKNILTEMLPFTTL